jgi:hypothetical protein
MENAADEDTAPLEKLFTVKTSNRLLPGNQREQTFSCETCDVPRAIVTGFLRERIEGGVGETRRKRFPFMSGFRLLNFEVVNHVVELVRQTDTPDAMTLNGHFQRGVFIQPAGTAGMHFTMKDRIRLQFAETCLKFSLYTDEAYAMLRDLFSLLHARRAKGVSRSPCNRDVHLLIYHSAEDRGIKFFDFSASDDRPRQRLSDPRPRVRANSFAVGTTSSYDNFRKACLCCNERYDKHLLKCGLCQCAHYCNVQCQRRDWPTHRGAECADMAARKQEMVAGDPP